MRKGDLCIFTEDNHPQPTSFLDATLFQIFIDRKITYAEFAKRHREFRLAEGWTSSQKITSDRNNLLKPILGINPLTYRNFEFILKNILQLNMTSFSMTFRDIDNKPFAVSVDRMTF